ncbi:hypothetical protein KEH51_19675 [[Brevibacterium] frigoritolerans]|uniref:Hsp20/alpha crystallin family protein n=1 Tax=Peribacillus frigoritolerans TaxID=450367 RepID=A0A941FL67_9BACI|nr:hypothetical protein [Peribacillus frigoritolerans]
MQDNQHGSQMTEVEKFDEWVKVFLIRNLCVGSSTFSIDIYESDDEYMVEAVLEDHDVKDIKVCLSDNELSIIVDDTHKPFLEKKKISCPHRERSLSLFDLLTKNYR